MSVHATTPEDCAASIRDRDREARLVRQRAGVANAERFADRNRFFHAEKARLFGLHVPRDASILHVGCGLGDTLARLKPRRGLGIDLAPELVALAAARHPELEFRALDPEGFALEETFDVVLLDDAIAESTDIQSMLECVHACCRPDTRVIIGAYSALWGPLLRTASAMGLRRPAEEHNWLGPEDLGNLLALAGFDVVRRDPEILVPLPIPLLAGIANRLLARFWPFRWLDLMQVFVARPALPPDGADHLTCTVVVPTRNERGNIEAAVARLPELGAGTELIFVDGSSTDGTPEEIARVAALHPERNIRFIPQGDGIGKGDAVRKAFEAATGDVLMILDADLTVPPEDLPRFVRALAEGRGEFVNGTRLVYPMEDDAMRFLNKIGNRFFSVLFTWLLGQRFRDTLCGTKVLTKRNYDVIAANRAHFGDFDPFGDFDLIFGAAKANLKIVEVPVRYRARTYGTTNISRFRHGWLLLKMSWVAFKRIKLR